MTVQELYELSLAMVGHTVRSDNAKDYFLGIANSCLAECYLKENGARKINGLTPLTQVPIMKDFNETIPFDDVITLMVVAQGCAARLAAEDENMVMAEYFGALYESGKQRPLMARYVDVGDVNVW